MKSLGLKPGPEAARRGGRATARKRVVSPDFENPPEVARATRTVLGMKDGTDRQTISFNDAWKARDTDTAEQPKRSAPWHKDREGRKAS